MQKEPHQREGEQERIESVQKPAVTRKQAARILLAAVSFDHRFNKVTDLTNNCNKKAEEYNPRRMKTVQQSKANNGSQNDAGQESSHRAFNRFLWAYALKEFVAAESHAGMIRPRITGNNYAQDEYYPVSPERGGSEQKHVGEKIRHVEPGKRELSNPLKPIRVSWGAGHHEEEGAEQETKQDKIKSRKSPEEGPKRE